MVSNRMAMLLLLLIFCPWAITGGAATRHIIGGDGEWAVPSIRGRSITFYQQWSNSVRFYSNDSLVFIYNSSSHNVWVFQDESSYSRCDFSGTNDVVWSQGAPGADEVVFTPGSHGLYYHVYFGSSSGQDCANGMRFSLEYYSCSSCAPQLQSPPPPSPPPPAPGLGSRKGSVLRVVQQSDSKTTVPVAAIAVPVVLVIVFVLGAGICWWSCRIRRARARAMAGLDPAPPMIRPGDPMPTLELIKVQDPDRNHDGDGGSHGNSSQRGVGSRSSNSRSNSTTTSAGLSSLFPRSGSTTTSNLKMAMTAKKQQPQPGRPGSPSIFSNASVSSSGSVDALGGSGGPRVFAYTELWEATDQFSADSLIGQGGFGSVYKGLLPGDATPVAIKVAMACHLGNAGEARRQLLNEVAVLSRLNHRNLVRLLGCCTDDDMLILVYEFAPNGMLLDHLRPPKHHQQQPSMAPASTTLDWPRRLRIAIQAAEALKYLHVQVNPPIFHRDVKTANILLDAHWNAKVADFGMSRPKHDLNATHVSTLVKGTTGYLDPEYFYSGQLTDKSDVYGFGVVLLELLTARKPVDTAQPRGQQNLAAVAVPAIVSGRVVEILDPRLLAGLAAAQDKQHELQAIQGVAMVAVACLVYDSQSRPSMSQVVEMLQKIKGPDLRAEDFFAGNPNAHGGLGSPRSGSVATVGLNIQPSGPGTVEPSGTGDAGRSAEYSASSLNSGGEPSQGAYSSALGASWGANDSSQVPTFIRWSAPDSLQTPHKSPGAHSGM